MKKNTLKNILSAVIFLSIAGYVLIKFGSPAFLKAYIETGIGNCETIPILCMTPGENVVKPATKLRCIVRLMPSSKDIPKISLCVPKGFDVVEEKIRKVYYKRVKRGNRGAVIYLLYEKPNFFVDLFPQFKKQGVNNDHEFIKRIMFAKLKEVKTITDAFFVIMKGVFIPDLGNQKEAKMIQFSLGDKYGFLNYNLGKPDNYFDCDVFNKEGDFFKVYIKDKGASLDLDSVFAIISTLKRSGNK